MTPKLYGIMGSPPFGAVLMCAKVLGIELEIVHVNLINGDHLKDEFIKINPQHTVPLLDDNGFFLADSHAIMGYLVGRYGEDNNSLYPKDDIKRRAIIDHRLQLDSSILASRAFLISKPLVLQGKKPEKETIEYLREAFAILDKLLELENTPYIAEDNLSIADFSIVTSVTTWGAVFASYTDFPHIKSYINRMEKESFFEANEKGVKAFKGLMELKLKQ